MKRKLQKFILLTLAIILSVGITFSYSQIRISEMPTYTGDPRGKWVPIVVNGANRKIDATNFGWDKIDSLSVASDTLWAYKRGSKAFYKLLPSGGGSPTWGTLQGSLTNQTDLQNALNAKQGVLVSGVDIKTINSQTLLGPGNLVISGGGGSGVWGAITGTLSDQTDLVSQFSLKANLNSPTFTGTVGGITKSMVGLSLVDNTTDLNKPVSTPTQNALNTKQDFLVSTTNIKSINGVSILGPGDMIISSGGGTWGSITGNLPDQADLQTAFNLKANLASPTFTGTVGGITKSMVGLSNVDNTTDANKPVSTATQTALNAKLSSVNLGYTASPTNGVVTNSAGTTSTISLSTSVNAGLMSPYDKRVIDSVFVLSNAPGTGSNLLKYVDAFNTYVRRLSISGNAVDTSASTSDVLSMVINNPVSSVFGRTGVVAAQSGDYSAFYPPASRTISTTSPLAGGGDLSANRTFSINTNGITYGLMQQSTASKLLGNPNGTTANLSEIGLGYGLAFSGTNLLIDSSKYATKWALDAAVIAAGGGVTTVFGRSGSVTAATNDYTWAQINKTTSSLADITTRSAGDLSSGTLPDGRLSSNVVVKNAAIDLNAQTLTNFAANINAQTGTTYTLVAGDMGKVVTLSNASAITLTVPSGLPVGFTCTVIQKGAGQITFTASGTTINNKSSHTKTSGQHAMTSLVSDVSNVFTLGGDTSN